VQVARYSLDRPPPYLAPSYAVPPGLQNEVTYMVQKYGARAVYEALDELVYKTYTDREHGQRRGLPWT
jgi:hypothetical protein